MAVGLLVLVGMLYAVVPAKGQEPPKRVIAYLANDTISLRSNATTVGGFLRELAISLPDGYWVDPPVDAALTDGMAVSLSSLSVTRGTSKRVIPATVEVSSSWRYGPAGADLVEAGQDGLLEVSCTIFYLDGQEVGRRQRETVLRKMKPRKVVYFHVLTAEDGPSTEEILAMRAKPGSHTPPPIRYKRAVTMQSSAYEPSPVSCGKFASGYTSIGLEAGYGVVAVDPKVIPLGTRLFIEGYGYAVAGDVGSAIKGNRVDVGMLTVEECYKWGRRDVKVFILY